MEEEKVSIVLPVYNGERYLRQSLESCLQQTHRNIELIVVDDCSTDATPQIIASCGDARIVSIRHERNSGLSRTLNTGFTAATAGYVTWTSDDNFYAPGAIETILHFLKSCAAAFAYGDYYALHAGQEDAPRLVRLAWPPCLDQRNCIGPFFLYTRAVMEVVGRYDEAIQLVEDYDYWLRVSKNFKPVHLDAPLYYYRYHDKSLTSNYYCELDMEIYAVLLNVKHGFIDMSQARKRLLEYTLERNGAFQSDMKAFRWYPINPRAYKKFLTSRYFRSRTLRKIQGSLRAFAGNALGVHEACAQLSGALKKPV